MNREPCSEYEDGYTEAISDLHRGFYEKWVTELDGDYVEMCEGLIAAGAGAEVSNMCYNTTGEHTSAASGKEGAE